MKTLKSIGIMLFAFGVLVAIEGCKSKDTAKQDKTDSGTASKPGLIGDVGTPTNALPVPTLNAAPAKELTLNLGNNVSMKLILIPAGKFMMGSPRDEKDRGANEGLAPGKWVNGNPQIEVTISKPFYLGVYEVTVDQYAQFVKDTGQSYDEPESKQTGDHPVVNVMGDDALAFCQWLSMKTGQIVQLPTEAQWEYACRAGTMTAYSFGSEAGNLSEYAWFTDNSKGKTHPVGQKKPNAWGLYDMHGNVWERCADSEANKADCLRGGCWGDPSQDCRAARHIWFNPYMQFNQRGRVGFRVAAISVAGVD